MIYDENIWPARPPWEQEKAELCRVAAERYAKENVVTRFDLFNQAEADSIKEHMDTNYPGVPYIRTWHKAPKPIRYVGTKDGNPTR